MSGDHSARPKPRATCNFNLPKRSRISRETRLLIKRIPAARTSNYARRRSWLASNPDPILPLTRGRSRGARSNRFSRRFRHLKLEGNLSELRPADRVIVFQQLQTGLIIEEFALAGTDRCTFPCSASRSRGTLGLGLNFKTTKNAG